MRHETWADRIYAWMLVFYPRRFRRQYGLDMVEMFRDARIDRARTGRSPFNLWVKTIRDLVLNASIMRMASFMKRLRSVGRNRHSHVGNRSLFAARITMEAMLLDIRYALAACWRASCTVSACAISMCFRPARGCCCWCRSWRRSCRRCGRVGWIRICR